MEISFSISVLNNGVTGVFLYSNDFPAPIGTMYVLSLNGDFKIGMILDIYVKEEYRRQGMATKLINYVFNNTDVDYLHTGCGTESGLPFILDIGFTLNKEAGVYVCSKKSLIV